MQTPYHVRGVALQHRVRPHIHNRVGRRWAIVPLHHADGELLHVDGEKPPTSAICLVDLAIIRQDFHGLTAQLCNVYEILRGRPAPFSESEEQPANRPNVDQIVNQLRNNLGLQFKPSRQKP